MNREDFEKMKIYEDFTPITFEMAAGLYYKGGYKLHAYINEKGFTIVFLEGESDFTDRKFLKAQNLPAFVIKGWRWGMGRTISKWCRLLTKVTQ